MSPEDFTAWVKLMKDTRGWSDAECARQLECGPNQIKRWRERASPRYVALACSALCHGLPPWKRPGVN